MAHPGGLAQWASLCRPTASLPAGRMTRKVCLVTGGGSGIGRATALKMAEEGAEAVVIAGRREAEIEATLRPAAIWARRRSRSKPTSRERTRSNGWSRPRSTATAGWMSPSTMPAFRSGAHRWRSRARAIYDEVFDTNVRSVFLLPAPSIARRCSRAGRGRIVINASVSGVRNPNPGLSLYSASKAAVISLVHSAAMEAAPRGVSDQCDRPGPRRHRHDAALRRRRYGKRRGRAAAASAWESPEEVAEAVVWLLSDASVLCGRSRAGGGRGISGVVRSPRKMQLVDYAVIANEVKQSGASKKVWIASLRLAMTNSLDRISASFRSSKPRSILLRIQQRHGGNRRSPRRGSCPHAPAPASAPRASSDALVTRTASQPMPSAIFTKSMPGKSSPGTLRTCITWLNERIAP